MCSGVVDTWSMSMSTFTEEEKEKERTKHLEEEDSEDVIECPSEDSPRSQDVPNDSSGCLWFSSSVLTWSSVMH